MRDLIEVCATLLMTGFGAVSAYRFFFQKKKCHKILSILGAVFLGFIVFVTFAISFADNSYLWLVFTSSVVLIFWTASREGKTDKDIHSNPKNLKREPSTSNKVEFKVATSKPPISPPNPSISTYSIATDSVKSKKSSNRISFTYEDAQGNITNREIRVDEVNDTYIEGYCYNAMDTRTFRLDRIIGLIEQDDEFYLPDDWLEKQGIVRKQTSSYSTKYKPKNLEICFTGFSRHTREELEELAEIADFTVRKSITQNLNFLVTGDNAGPSKISKAIDVGATLLDEDEFREMIETGEIPE
ncbi:BRCT domain-containing protein [Rodentibacter pneumotropicus]|uniref:BRCT domain-containing protein n=1 Tax=Rodentibacter pneumotropicus TaxID=758 RepID=UPI0009C5717D|nr:BRCT domain-containing protein [Rodentibacter pneumotropicus]OOF64778.1 hypothetical protein BKL50_00795 [Rodentibacter pneumotropicus]